MPQTFAQETKRETEIADDQSLSGTTLAASTFSTETIVPSPTPGLEHRFYKGNGFSSKASIRSTTDKDFQLLADIHRSKPSTMQLVSGPDAVTTTLGTLTFPHTYNSFQIHIGEQLIQVRARVGHPHPSSYLFTLPASDTAPTRSLVWKAFGQTSSSTGYHLYEEGTNVLLASWQLCSKEKYQAVLRWHVAPRDEMMERAVLLSYIGALTRLKLKGKDDSERGNGLARWNGMWFMAILGTAAVS